MKKGKFSFAGKAGKADEKFKGGSNYGYLQLPEGVGVFSPELETSVTFDIMPYVVTDQAHPERDDENDIAQVGDLWWRRPFKIHRNVGSENISVVCLQSFGKKCPICEYKAKLQKEGKLDDDAKEALKTSERVLYCIIPLNAKGKKDGKALPKTPHIFDISYAMFGKKLKKEMEDENVSEICMDLQEGSSLKVRFDEKSMGGKNSKPFAEAGRIDSKEREKPYKEDILEKIPNLDAVLKQLTYKEMETKFFELEAEGDEDQDEKSKGSKKTAKVEKEEPADLTWDELSEMSEKQMIKFIDKEELQIDTDDFEDDETGLRKAIAAELDIEIPKKKTAKKEAEAPVRKKKPEPEPEDEFTWDDISGFKDTALRDIVEEKTLDIDPDDYEDDIKAFRKAIAKELGIKIPKTVPQPAEIAEKDKCPVCKGTGKNKKGGACETCAGTGVKQKKKADDDDDDLPFNKGVKGSSSSKTKECPEGYKYGVDTDKKEECEACDLWDDCMEAKKKNKK